MAIKRRTVIFFLSLLALFLLGTVAVLSTISFYLRIDLSAYVTEGELLSNGTSHIQTERIPRIIHQTWKTDSLPEHTFDAYTYPIQRADAIRYFVLYHYGGVYIDLDIGCLRSLDPLLQFPVILPKTIPVGVSNDLMFSAKHHPFMEQTIHNLITFDHSYFLNYPTVMFSTGPMFLSAQLGLYTASHPSTPDRPGGDVRILPKPLYGKNAKLEEAPHSFFSHHYGSSWHADDAAFITFLGKWGKVLMWIGVVILVLGTLKLLLQKRNRPKHGELLRRYFAFGRYDVVLPRVYQRDERYQVDFGFITMTEAPTEPSSPISLASDSVSISESSISPISLDSSSFFDHPETSKSFMSRVALKLRRVPQWVVMSVAGSQEPRRRRGRGVLYFLPAIFTLNTSRPTETHIEDNLPLLPTAHSRDTISRRSSSRPGSRPRSPTLQKNNDLDDLVEASTRPPPYEDRSVNRSRGDRSAREGGWNEWST
ncbi:hypothetical protein Clacol_001682 [Clathrus columnatus]|uniref:Glycosyltransferase family 32 protein n=1 Tax=Clathrus columnatus TaxID=1419009 RepID=A0AAV5A6D9_9AGAM|nr:hypothetical protein Clacol_001682 [Clathrus columnatus]